MLCNPKVHYRIYRNPSHFLILSQINLVHTFPFYSCTPVPTAGADHLDAATKRAAVAAFWQGRPATGPLYRGRPESKDRSHAHSLLPERKQCFKSLTGKFLSIQHLVHTWPQAEGILNGSRFRRNEEVKDDVKAWLNGLAAEGSDEGIQRLVAGCDKCLNFGGD